jgi:hypothetical protein
VSERHACPDRVVSLQALALTSQAARLQLQHKYENSGNELAVLFVSIWSESTRALTPEIRNLINDIANCFENVVSLGVPFLKDCIALSASLGPRQLGDAILHRQLACKLWRLKPTEKIATGEDNVSGENDGDDYSDYRSAAVLHFAMGEAPEALWQQVSV